MLYNNPVAYKTDFLPEQIAALAAEHENLHAVKESSGDVRRITAIREVCDGTTWKRDQISSLRAACWVGGLPDNCDRANIRAWLGDVRLVVEHAGAAGSDGIRQINLRLPEVMAAGSYTLRLECSDGRAHAILLLL